MPFLVYEKQDDYLFATGKHFSLAGYNLIYRLWEKAGRPINQGWHMSADDLIQEHTGGKGTIDTHALLVNFHPGAKTRIELIEILDIYAYTYPGETQDTAGWKPMMLRLRDVFYEEYKHEISREEKTEKLKRLKAPVSDEDFIEFLYLNGDDKGWNWGSNGMTNAAFIHGPARQYFRQFL